MIAFKDVLLQWPGHPDSGKMVRFLLDDEGQFQAWSDNHGCSQVFEGERYVISPGFCELDAHFREPGLEEAETIKSGLDAAVAGGFTQVLLHANTQPVVDNKASVRFVLQAEPEHLAQARVKGAVTVGLQPDGLSEMYEMSAQGASIFGSDPFTPINTNTLLKALQYTKSFNQKLIIPANTLKMFPKGTVHEGQASLFTGLRGLPVMAEVMQLETIGELIAYTGASIHIAGVSSKEGLESIRLLKSKYPNQVSCDVPLWNLIYNETCVFEFDTDYKFFPPLRSEEDRLALIQGVNEGIIDAVTASHQPWEVEYKHVEFDYARSGSIGLQSFFSLYLKHLQKDIPLDTWVRVAAEGPRSILEIDLPEFGMEGKPLELTCWDRELEWELNDSSNFSKSKNTPVWETTLKGKACFVCRAGRWGILN